MSEYFDQASIWFQRAYEITPWARGGLLIVIIASILLAVPGGRLLRSNVVIVGLLFAAYGAVLVFTLTPQTRIYGVAETCSYALTRPTRTELVEPTDISMNMLLLFPVGVLLTWLRPLIAVLATLFIAIVTPFAVEFAQYAIARLGRTCSFYDIATNELGLFLGVGVGILIRLIWVIGAKIGRAGSR